MKELLFILIISSIGCYTEWWQNSKVPDLTNKDFFQVVGKDKWVFVKFYTTWCTYCRKMAPEFDKLYSLIEDSKADIVIRRLEGDSNEKITDTYGIHSFPKLALFRPKSKNVYLLYKGKRTAEEMLKFIIQSLEISSDENELTNTTASQKTSESN
jgi:thiol-disulfide isomerase/thioredoxin